jgi:hypothetical protein
MASLRAPAGLAKSGSKLWRDVTGKYALRVDELRILEDACRLADVLAALEAAAADAPLLSKGSMGQLVLHPLVAEQKTHRSALARLLAQLKLPDDATAEGAQEPNQHRAAAQTRWASAHGASA